jgi:hypothetical protein
MLIQPSFHTIRAVGFLEDMRKRSSSIVAKFFAHKVGVSQGFFNSDETPALLLRTTSSKRGQRSGKCRSLNHFCQTVSFKTISAVLYIR